jgi:3-hydroxyacyl-[acyl-carrier-protein] dehydratase
MNLDKEKVKSFLPHREPFLFVDSVESIKYLDEKKNNGKIDNLEGCEIKAKYFISPDHPILAGHFPGNPIVPGVVQVEMMAQVSSFSLYRLFNKPIEEINLKLALLSVSNAKFRKPIVPNMELNIVALCTKFRGKHSTYDCKIYHNGELMSEASLFASFDY